MIGRGKKAKDAVGTARRLWQYLRYYGRALSGVTALVTASTVLGALGPLLMGRAIDRKILPGDLPGIAQIAVLMALVYLCGAATSWLQAIAMVNVSQKTLRNLRKDLFSRLQELSLRFFDRNPHGELMSRVANDIENINNVLSQSVTQLIASVLTMVFVTIMMFVLNPKLALVAMITLPVMAFVTSRIAKRTRSGFRDQQRNLGTLNGIIEERISGQRVVAAFGRQADAIEEFSAANVKVRASGIQAQIFAGLLGPLSNFVNHIGFTIVACAGGWFAVHDLITVGMVAAFLSYARQFTRPVNQIASLYNMIQSALAGAERVFEIIDEVPEIEDSADAIGLKDTKGHVEFRDVSFGYVEGTPVLEQVSFEALPGQTVALVGPTGAGKTTQVNLLSRFYDIDSGSILLDGIDIRRIKKDDLRRSLGVVLQDTYLFSLSVIDNIRYGNPEATDDEIRQAAVLANADQFIRHLPDGYETMLSEDGSNLSQGQRQLMAIARAALSDPAILILDEATSSVDTRTEVHIQQALLRLMDGRTSFVIAHRLSTIRNADLILVIDGGRIRERGTHQELLDAQGFYHTLYSSQFRGLEWGRDEK